MVRSLRAFVKARTSQAVDITRKSLTRIFAGSGDERALTARVCRCSSFSYVAATCSRGHLAAIKVWSGAEPA
jgi:hypothetical protein